MLRGTASRPKADEAKLSEVAASAASRAHTRKKEERANAQRAPQRVGSAQDQTEAPDRKYKSTLDELLERAERETAGDAHTDADTVRALSRASRTGGS